MTTNRFMSTFTLALVATLLVGTTSAFAQSGVDFGGMFGEEPAPAPRHTGGSREPAKPKGPSIEALLACRDYGIAPTPEACTEAALREALAKGVIPASLKAQCVALGIEEAACNQAAISVKLAEGKGKPATEQQLWRAIWVAAGFAILAVILAIIAAVLFSFVRTLRRKVEFMARIFGEMGSTFDVEHDQPAAVADDLRRELANWLVAQPDPAAAPAAAAAPPAP